MEVFDMLNITTTITIITLTPINRPPVMCQPIPSRRRRPRIAISAFFLLLSSASSFLTTCPPLSSSSGTWTLTQTTSSSSTFATFSRSSLHLLHASSSESSLMDAIITPKRVEALPGFSVVERIDGLAFVRYTHNPSTPSSSSSSTPPSTPSSGMEKRGEILYLPGLDGSGCTLGPQIPDLVDQFDVWVLSIPPDDRSSLSLLTQTVIRHLEKRSMDRKNDKDDGDTEDNEPRVPVLVGESFGGLLALTVLRALGKEKARQYVRAALLVNPATSFDKTLWPFLVPLFRSLPPPIYPLAVTPVLLGVGPDASQFRRVLGRIFSPSPPPPPPPFPPALGNAPGPIKEMLDLVTFLTQTIPLETLQWRVT
ncbi:hypothetical protein VYU27_008721, partial [Nannochloropsis oceanica]